MSNSYQTGTATVTSGGTSVTGAGTMWAATLLPGDLFCRPGVAVPVAAVASNTSLTLEIPWPGTTAQASSYWVLYTSPQRTEAGYVSMRTREMIARLALLEANVPYYRVQTLGANAPPSTPTANDSYVVGAAPTGAWAGQANNVATWTGAAWLFAVPEGGWHVRSIAADAIYSFDGAAWLPTNGVASVVGQTGVVSAAHIKNAIASAYIQSLLPAADGAAARATLGVTGAWVEGAISNGGFRNLFRNARFLINQRAFVSGGSLAAKAFGIDGVAGGPSGAVVGYTNDGSGLFDRYLSIASGSVVLPIPGADIAGGNYRLSYEGTAQYRIWAGTPSGSYATALRSAGGAAVTLTAGVDAFVEFTGGTLLRPQLEIGNLGPFERVPLDLEIARCLAFFERRTALHIGGGTVFAGVGLGAFIFYARKRTSSPTITFNNASDLRATMGSAAYTVALGAYYANSGSALVTAAGPPTAGESGMLNYATARSIDISSELVW